MQALVIFDGIVGDQPTKFTIVIHDGGDRFSVKEGDGEEKVFETKAVTKKELGTSKVACFELMGETFGVFFSENYKVVKVLGRGVMHVKVRVITGGTGFILGNVTGLKEEDIPIQCRLDELNVSGARLIMVRNFSGVPDGSFILISGVIGRMITGTRYGTLYMSVGKRGKENIVYYTTNPNP